MCASPLFNTIKYGAKYIFNTKTQYGKLFTPMDFQKNVCYEAVPYINKAIRTKDCMILKTFGFSEKIHNIPILNTVLNYSDDIINFLC